MTTQRKHRKQLLIKTAAWLVAEVVLNLAGLDNIADYSEFVFEQDAGTTIAYPTIVTTAIFERSNFSSLFT